MEHAYDRRFVEPHYHAFRDCRDSRQAPWLAGQAALAEKIRLPVDCDDCVPALVRDDRDLDLAGLNVKDGIRQVSLREDALILSIFRYGPPLAHGGEKRLDIERRLCFHGDSSLPTPAMG